MSQEWKSLPARYTAVTVDALLEATEVDGDGLTLDEILTAPVEAVEAELKERGWSDYEIDAERLALAMLKAKLPQAEPAEPATLLPLLVDRFEHVAALRAEITEHLRVVLTGTYGSGKSYLIDALLRDVDFRTNFTRVIRVNCSALRMGSPIVFGREAVWAHFGKDDDGYKRFIANLSGDEQETTALTALMEQRLQGGGLVVFDHVEEMSRSHEIDRWLTDQLFPRASEIGVHILFVHAAPVKQFRAALRGTRECHLPEISEREISRWLAGPQLQALYSGGLSARSIVHFTGGRPQLVRDLGLFIQNNPRLSGGAVMRAFLRWRSRDHQFFTDCERLVRVARRYPEVIERALTPGELCQGWSKAGLPAEGVAALLATGAIRGNAAGRLVVATPLYAQRLRRLAAPNALSALAVRTDFQQIDCTSSWKTLRRYGELASDALAKSLGYESSPVVGLQRLIMFLLRWEFRAKIFVRDQDISRLWAPFDRPDQIEPLESWKRPDFALAAQTGQIARADDGRIFIPIISYTGNATMMIVLQFVKEFSPLPCTRQVDIDRVAGVIEGIQPTLAQLVQRMALRRDRKFQGKLWYKSQRAETPSGRDGLLREVGCQSLVVFKREGNGDWMVSRFQRTGDRDDSLRWTEGFSAARLDGIVRHRSRRGLVLSGDHAAEAFPRLMGRDVALYLHPVASDGDMAIVVLLFEGDAATLDGYVQTRLSVFAPDMLKVA